MFNTIKDLEHHLSSVYLNKDDVNVQYETQNISLKKDDEHIDLWVEYQKFKSNPVLTFEEAIKNGPYYICVVCNRCLYKTTVKKFVSVSYKGDSKIWHKGLTQRFIFVTPVTNIY